MKSYLFCLWGTLGVLCLFSAQTLHAQTIVFLDDVEPQVATFTFDDFTPTLHSSYHNLASEPNLQGAPYYELNLTIHPTLDVVEGQQVLYYTNRTGEFLEDIGILLLPNQAGALMKVHPVEDPQVVRWQFEGEKNHALRVKLREPLAPDAQIKLSFYFTLEVPRVIYEGYGLISLQGGILSLAHSYGMVASYQGDWQLQAPKIYGDMTYAESSFYKVTLRTPTDLVVASTGEVIQKSVEPSGNILEIVAGPARDFYISASYNYEVVEKQQGPWQVRSFYLEDRGEVARAQALQILEHSADALEFFSEHFGAYPYQQFSIVPLRTRALGMEFPAIVALNDLFYSGGASLQGASMRTRVTNTIVHEVAHQWFYNLVGNDQIREPWLDEAPTQYITLFYHQMKHPNDYAYYYDELYQRAAGSLLPVDQPVENYAFSDYVQAIYGVAPMRFVTMAQVLGEATFESFLQQYLQHYRWQQASQEDFFALLLRYDSTGTLRERLEPWFDIP